MRDTTVLLHDTRRLDRVIVRLTVLIWVIHGAIVIARAFAWGTTADLGSAMARVASTVVGIALSLGVWRILKRGAGGDVFDEFKRAALWSAGACLIHTTANETFFRLMSSAYHADPVRYLAPHEFIPTYFGFLWIFVTWSALYSTLVGSEALRQQEREVADARDAVQHARLAALRNQIQPHFLFNALNAISGLIGEKRTAEADQALLRLAGFYRHTLAFAPREFVTLKAELDAQKLYLAIEEVRFSDRLHCVFEVDPEAESAMVPSLVLQPFVENAIKHGLARSAGSTLIRVEARAVGDRLQLSVTDDSEAVAPCARTGLGASLINARQRLTLIYDDDFDLAYGPRPDRGWAVSLDLPLELEAPL